MQLTIKFEDPLYKPLLKKTYLSTKNVFVEDNSAVYWSFDKIMVDGSNSWINNKWNQEQE